jgi:uncharacterized membrane protein
VLRKLVSLELALAVLSLVAIIVILMREQPSEQFTEFYLLGPNGEGTNYPAVFLMQTPASASDAYPFPTRVQYAGDPQAIVESYGRAVLGISNREQRPASYVVKMEIDGTPSEIWFKGDNVTQMGPTVLSSGIKWEGAIGISPRQIGEHQKVKLLLFKNGSSESYRDLYFWIDANLIATAPSDK